MNFEIISIPKGANFYVCPLRLEELDTAVKVCDISVGKNLYTKDYLEKSLRKDNHFFVFLRDFQNEIAGYIYFYVEDFSQTAQFLKMTPEGLKTLTQDQPEKIIHIRSISILEPYRRQRLARGLIGWALKYANQKVKATAAIVVCWKPRGQDCAPLARTVEDLKFYYIASIPRFWYNVPNLECPYCEDRCQCDAVVYYKKL